LCQSNFTIFHSHSSCRSSIPPIHI
jgi:hypothetical protein